MRRSLALWVILPSLLLLTAFVSMRLGPSSFARSELADAVFALRAYRSTAAVLAGASLAMAGVLVQGLFRNPLASPSILGTASGASLGGMIALFFWQFLITQGLVGAEFMELGVPLGCCLGAAVSLLLLLAALGRTPSTLGLLLGGVVLSSFFASAGSLLVSFAYQDPNLGRALVAFSMGGLAGAGRAQVALALPMVVVSALMAWRWARPLDLLLTGEQEASTLGLDVDCLRKWLVLWVAMLTAAAIAIGGNLSFVGLVVPHLLRPFVGALHRSLLVASAMGGALFVLGADLLTRMMPLGFDLPLGVVTSLVGAPLFLSILIRSQREGVSA